MQNDSTPCFSVRILDFPIMLVEIIENGEVDEIQAYLMKETLESKAQGGNYFVLLDATNNFTVTAEARKLIASKEFSEKRLAAAFVTNSLANKLTGNFFIKINKPHTPVRLFNSKDEALKWLKGFIQ